jgi:hypothetical protein
MSNPILDAIEYINAAPKVKMGRGKGYTQISSRVEAFRLHFNPEDWGVVTEVARDDGEVIQVRATILYHDGEGSRIIATGTAEEVRGSSSITRTSALEVCETSAIGRALAAMALHGGEFASANEVENAIHEQEKPVADKDTIDKLLGLLKDGGMTAPAIDEYRATLRIAKWQDLTQERAERLMEKMESKLSREYAEGEAAGAAADERLRDMDRMREEMK